MKYCKFCGAQLKDGVKFCSSCGNKVVGEDTSRPEAGGQPESGSNPQTTPKTGKGKQADAKASSPATAGNSDKKKSKAPLIILIIVLLLVIAGIGCYLMRDTLFPEGLPFIASADVAQDGEKGTIKKESDGEEDAVEGDGGKDTASKEDEVKMASFTEYDSAEAVVDAFFKALEEKDEEELNGMFLLLKSSSLPEGDYSWVDMDTGYNEGEHWDYSIIAQEQGALEKFLSDSYGSSIYGDSYIQTLTDAMEDGDYQDALEIITVRSLDGAGSEREDTFVIAKDDKNRYAILLVDNKKQSARVKEIVEERVEEKVEEKVKERVKETEEEALHVPEFGKLEAKGHCDDVDLYVKKIDAMRRAAAQYVGSDTDYLVVGDGDDRKVVFCRMDGREESLYSLMDEYGYSNYSVDYYFDNELDGAGEHLCEGPNYVALRIGQKLYEYYFVGNQLIRRISEDGVHDNPETNDFLASIYSLGHDFADKILSGYGEYIIPDSDTRRLSEEELSGMSANSLQLARNEIYARHGRKFMDDELQAYFNSKSWYYGTIEPGDFSEDMLSSIEKDNVKTIKKVEGKP